MPAAAQTRFVIVTGGVVSSLGKGIAGASLGNLLRARGLKVRQAKADPYWNLDPGTMSPGEHGEIFLTADGAECDLDLGHYERFTDVPTLRTSSFSFGQVANEVLRKERAGEYLGATVQITPHVTDEIRRRIMLGAEGADVAIIEIGGTVGDMESRPFMEALRQMRRELGPERMCFVHCTLVPWIAAAGELKTKPTQHSVAEMRSLGLSPDVVLLRAEQPVPAELKDKIALMCDLPDEAVISCPDARDAYEVPLILNAEGLDELVCRRLRLDDAPAPDLDPWRSVCERLIGASVPVRIAVVGKYGHPDAYLSIREALRHAAAHQHRRLEMVWVDAEQVTADSAPSLFSGVAGILVPGGFGERGVEGKIATARYARENQVPYLGICLGMQVAVIEFARHVAHIRAATSREFSERAKNCVIDLSHEQKGVKDKGGTMRLGEQQMNITPGTLLHGVYGSLSASERHRHRFEVAERYVEQLEAAGLVIGARHPERGLVECIELPADQHPYFIATQSHPEFSSRPVTPNPLFVGLIAAALGHPVAAGDPAEAVVAATEPDAA